MKKQRMEEIEGVAARLFAHKGYHHTSMREIARWLDMNQSSLYHYFKSKEDILFKLMNDAMDDALEKLDKICSGERAPADKLQKILYFYVRYYAGDQDRLILLVNEMGSLGKTYRELLAAKQRQYVELLRSVLDELAARQKLKDISTTVATFAFFGMVHYTIKWYQKEGHIGLDELADSFVVIFSQGILDRV